MDNFVALFETYAPSPLKLKLNLCSADILDANFDRFYQFVLPTAKEIDINYEGLQELENHHTLSYAVGFLHSLWASPFVLPPEKGNEESIYLKYFPRDVWCNLVEDVQLRLHIFDIAFTVKFYWDGSSMKSVDFWASQITLDHTVLLPDSENSDEVQEQEFYQVEGDSQHQFNIDNFKFKDLVRLSDFEDSDEFRPDDYEIVIPIHKISEAYYEVVATEDEISEEEPAEDGVSGDAATEGKPSNNFSDLDKVIQKLWGKLG